MAPRRKRAGLQILRIATVVVFVLSFGLTLRFAITPSRSLARWVEAKLRELGAPPVEVGEAWFDPRTLAVVLRNLKIGDDPKNPDAVIARLSVSLGLDWSETFRVRRILIERPVVRTAALDRLLPKGAARRAIPTSIPPIDLIEGRVLADVPAFGTLTFSELRVTARPGDRGELRIAGRAMTPYRGALAVRGSLDPVTGAAELEARTETDVDLGQASDTLLAPEAERWKKQLKPEGMVGYRVRFSRAGADAPLRVEGRLDASGVAVTVPGLDVRPTDVRLALSLDPDGSARIGAAGRLLGASWSLLAQGSIDPLSREPGSFEGGVRIRELLMGPAVRAVLGRIDRGVLDVYDGLEPEGPADAIVSFSRAAGQPDFDLTATLELKNSAITFRGFRGPDDTIDAAFPYRLTDVEGLVSYSHRERRIALTAIRARMGAGEVVCAGEVTGVGRVGIDIHVHGEGIVLDDAVAQAVPSLPGGGEAWKLFDLHGKVGFDIRASRPEGETRALVTVRLTSSGGVDGTFKDFPVPFEGMSGSVTFERGVAVFAFDGDSRGGRIRVEGVVDGASDASGKEPTVQAVRLRICARGFRLDPALASSIAVAAPRLSSLILEQEPSGACDFEYRGERVRNAAIPIPAFDLAMRCEHGVVRRVPRLDLPLEDVAASVRVVATPREGNELDYDMQVSSLRARYRNAPVRAVVAYRSIASSVSLDIRAAGFDLPFDKQLLSSMVGGGSETAKKAIERYDFGGRFDMVLERRLSPLVDATFAEIRLRDVAVSGPGLPGLFDRCTGRLTIDSRNRVEGETLTGRLDGIPVQLEKFRLVPPHETSPLHLEGVLTSAGPVGFAEAISKTTPEARAWMADADFDAQVEPQSLSWTLDVPENDTPVFEAQGTLRVYDGWALPGALLGSMRGIAEVSELRFDKEGFRTTVRLRDAEVRFLPWTITEVSALLELTPRSLKISDVSAKSAGGTLRSSRSDGTFTTVAFTKPQREWTVNMRATDADLAALFANVPLGGGEITGKLGITMNLRGVGGDFKRISGGGQISCTDAGLFGDARFKPAFEGLRLKRVPRFSEMSSQFRVGNGLVRFERLSLMSDELDLYGGGEVGFDWTIRMLFQPRPRFAALNPMRIIRPIVNVVQDTLLDLEVYGDLRSPKYRVRFGPSDRVTMAKPLIAPEPPIELGDRF